MPKLKTVNVKGRRADELSGLFEILEYARQGDGKPEPVQLVNADLLRGPYNGERWSHYGTDLNYVEEAFEFSDGRILMCATVSSWNGTFASHDSISVKYYAIER
jgi:hypothetical protein